MAIRQHGSMATWQYGNILIIIIIELFRKEELGIEANANLNTVDFLDVHFNLSQNTYNPFFCFVI